jgi:hypothetical protein
MPPQILNETVDNYNKDEGWFSGTLRKVGRWYDNNSDWIQPLLHLGAAALLDEEGDLYVDADQMNLRLRRMIPYLENLPDNICA